MNFDLDTHTLIIGGGPAGSILARKLSKNDIPNILVEKNHNFKKPCGGGVRLSAFEEFDIPLSLENKRVLEFDLFSLNKKASLNLNKAPVSIVLRKEFDKKNRELAKKEGTTLIIGRFIKFEKANNFFITNIKDKDKKLIKIKSKYLVAADGVNSSVRNFLNKPYKEKILTIYSDIDNLNIEKCEFYFGQEFAPNEYAYVFPHGDKISIGSVLRNDKNSMELFNKFKEKVAPNSNSKIKGYYIPTWRKDTKLYEDGVFFVGDAAGQVLPFNYEGIYYAMKSGSLLADVIIKEKPLEYEIKWNEKYQKRFILFKTAQKIFLSSSFMCDKLISFFQNERLQNRALQFWEGTSKPLDFFQTIFKIVKHVIKT